MKVYLHCYEFHEPLFSIFYKTKVHEILYYYNLIRIIPGGSLEGFSFVPEMKAELEKLDVILDSNFEMIGEEGIHLCSTQKYENVNKFRNNCNPNAYYYFIDFLICEPIGGFKSENNIDLFKLPNVRFLTPTYPLDNTIFDMGVIIRYNTILNAHYSLSDTDLFHSIVKKYRIDFSTRNIFGKKERIGMLEKLFELNLNNIKLSYDKHFINLFKVLKKHEDKISKKDGYYILNELINVQSINVPEIQQLSFSENVYKTENGANLVDKIFSVTLQSDISLVFESGTLDIYNTQINYANHISEKTLDLLLIGKPFIMCSKLIYEFFKLLNLNTYEDIFEINYNEVFKDNSFNQQLIIDLLIKINNMNDLEYKEFLSKLNNKAIENKNIIKKASEENTFYTDMIALNHFKN
jgi:hypothetical protein